MKSKIILALSILAITFSLAQKAPEKPQFNQQLATELGADQYGMKPYVIRNAYHRFYKN